MGKKKQNPRYNILCCRVSDDLRACITHAPGGRTIQEYLHTAVEEKLIDERQERMNAMLKDAIHTQELFS